MAELPDGEIIERRRGGPGVLALLMLDATRSRFNGHLRIERASSNGFVGNLGILDGMPIMALSSEINSSTSGGKESMEKCLSESAMDDARISIHEGGHIPESMDLHPHSRLLKSDIQNLEEQPWWSDTRHRDLVSLGQTKSRWTSIETEFSRDGSEEIFLEETAPPSIVSDGPSFGPGQSWLVDDEVPDSVLGIASNLQSLGRPLLVFSRLPPGRLRSKYAIHESSSVRLTERPVEKGDIGPSLEGIMKRIEDFLFANPRAVVIIDGLEFLIGLHGFDRVYDFSRNLTDLVAESDDLLICPIDGLAMSPQERALLQREMEMLDTHTAALWAGQGGKLAGHPFIIHAMTTTPEPRILETIDESPSATDLNSNEELPEPIEDIRHDIGSLIEQWKTESTIVREEAPSEEFSEVEPDLEIIEPVIEEESDDFTLPEWAIEPSPNMGDNEIHENEIEENIEIAPQLNEVPEVEVMVRKSVRPRKSPLQKKVKRTGPRDATVDHKPKARVRKVAPPQEHVLRTDGLRDAAERWREIMVKTNHSSPIEAIPSSGKEIQEFNKKEHYSDDESSDLLRNARKVEGEWMPKGLEDARRHEIIHSSSKMSPENKTVREPPSTAREFASAHHRRLRDFSSPQGNSLDSTELPENFYDRLAKLVEKGENIGEIMASVERSPTNALLILEKMEGRK